MLSAQQKKFIQDKEFLLEKVKILEQVEQLLATTRSGIMLSINSTTFKFPEGIKLKSGKISKGENYLNLPYQVLDYPALFDGNNIFAYRTMFWWGNFFSATFHLQGQYLKQYKDTLINKIDTLVDEQIYISKGSRPWQYHYENDNYLLINKSDVDHIRQCEFLKLSKKIPLDDWDNIPNTCTEYFEFILSVLNKR